MSPLKLDYNLYKCIILCRFLEPGFFNRLLFQQRTGGVNELPVYPDHSERPQARLESGIDILLIKTLIGKVHYISIFVDLTARRWFFINIFSGTYVLFTVVPWHISYFSYTIYLLRYCLGVFSYGFYILTNEIEHISIQLELAILF